MAEMLSCRMCRHPLTVESGCVVCLPVKEHLIVSADDGAQIPLAVVATQGIGMLQRQLAALDKAQSGARAYDPVLANETRAVTNAIAKLADSTRKLIQDGADAVEAMSFQEKAALFLEWTASLPSAYRRRLVTQVEAQGTVTPGGGNV